MDELLDVGVNGDLAGPEVGSESFLSASDAGGLVLGVLELEVDPSGRERAASKGLEPGDSPRCSSDRVPENAGDRLFCAIEVSGK